MWESKFKTAERTGENLAETSTVNWLGRWWRMEYFRKNYVNSPAPEINFAQIRDLDKNKIVGRCMEGFERHSAFAWENAFYVFATDYWNIYMSKSFDLDWWSKPVMALNNRSMVIQHQNNSVCWDGKRFVMAVDLLGGPYNFTVCFAYSYDLQEFHYIPGAVYRADLYTSSPRLSYVDGWYYLIHGRNTDRNKWWNARYLGKPGDLTPEEAATPHPPVPEGTGNWWFEAFVTRSRNLLTWEDAPKNPILSPDPTFRVKYMDGRTKPECCVADLYVYERDGKTIGEFQTGTKEAGIIPDQTHCRAEFPVTLAEFFGSLYE